MTQSIFKIQANGISFNDAVITASGTTLTLQGENTQATDIGANASPGVVFITMGPVLDSRAIQLNGALVPASQYPNLMGKLRATHSININTAVQIPTSNIIPSASSFIDWRDASQAFNGVTYETSGGWHSNPYLESQWLQAQLLAPATVVAYRLWIRTDGMGIFNWKVFGSNDGVTFTLIDNRSFEPSPPNGSYSDFQVQFSGEYTYYKIQSDNPYYYTTIAEWELFTSATITDWLVLEPFISPQLLHPGALQYIYI